MLPFFNLWTMRYRGVMQRIGVTYWLAAGALPPLGLDRGHDSLCTDPNRLLGPHDHGPRPGVRQHRTGTRSVQSGGEPSQRSGPYSYSPGPYLSSHLLPSEGSSARCRRRARCRWAWSLGGFYKSVNSGSPCLDGGQRLDRAASGLLGIPCFRSIKGGGQVRTYCGRRHRSFDSGGVELVFGRFRRFCFGRLHRSLTPRPAFGSMPRSLRAF